MIGLFGGKEIPPCASLGRNDRGESGRKKKGRNLVAASLLYWVGESNSYCEIENLEY